MRVWGGHSCPPLLIWVVQTIVFLSDKPKPTPEINVKGGEQECPPHTLAGLY